MLDCQERTFPFHPIGGMSLWAKVGGLGGGLRSRFRQFQQTQGAKKMTSAATGATTRGRHAEGHGYGLVLFASVLLVIVGCFNLIYGIAAIANSHVFTANAHYVFGSLRTWGWITLIIGALQVLAAGGVLAGNQLARWFAVAVVGGSAPSTRCSSSRPTRSGH